MADPVFVGSKLEFTIPVVLGTGGQTALVIFHTFVDGPVVGTPSTQDMATAMDALVATSVRAMLSNQDRYQGTGCRLIAAPPTRRMFAGTGNAGLGTVVSSSLPTQTRAIITWRTAFAGRGERGRNYLWPFPNTFSDPVGNVTAGGQAAMLTFANLLVPGPIVLVVGGNSASQHFSIYKRSSTLMTTVSDLVIRTRFGTQKRSGSLGRQNPPPF